MKRLKSLILPTLTALLILVVLWPRSEPTVRVVVAARDLGAGTVLHPADLQVVTMPAASAPQDAVSDTESLVGKTLAVVRFQGEPITPRHLGPAVQLQPDEVGIGIRVRADTGLAGLLRPGMKVGVVATLKVGEEVFAKALIAGVRVVYVPPEFQARPYEPVTATADREEVRVSGPSSAREGVIVVAASTRPVPLYHLSQEAQDLVGEGLLEITAEGTVTTTVPAATAPETAGMVPVVDQEVETWLRTMQPTPQYVVPLEVLAALNAQGEALTLVLLPEGASGDFITAGFHVGQALPLSQPVPEQEGGTP